MVILSKLGLCPPLFGKFKNGLAYGCIPGQVFKVSDMRDPHKMELVARKLAIWHGTVTIPGERSSKLFKTIHKWIKEGTWGSKLFLGKSNRTDSDTDTAKTFCCCICIDTPCLCMHFPPLSLYFDKDIWGRTHVD